MTTSLLPGGFPPLCLKGKDGHLSIEKEGLATSLLRNAVATSLLTGEGWPALSLSLPLPAQLYIIIITIGIINNEEMMATTLLRRKGSPPPSSERDSTSLVTGEGRPPLP